MKKVEEILVVALKEIQTSKTARLKGLNLKVTEKQFQDSVGEQMFSIEQEVNSVIKNSLIFLKKHQNIAYYKQVFRSKISFLEYHQKLQMNYSTSLW